MKFAKAVKQSCLGNNRNDDVIHRQPYRLAAPGGEKLGSRWHLNPFLIPIKSTYHSTVGINGRYHLKCPPRLDQSTAPKAAKRACHALEEIRESRIIKPMRTVIETPTFQKQADLIWTENERLEFIAWIAAHPEVGDVIPSAEGARKVRWKRAGTGKSGGTRIIYFNLVDDEVVLLVAVYAKAERENMTAKEVKGLQR